MTAPDDHEDQTSALRLDDRLLTVLERLLAIESTDLHTALDQATQLIADTLPADKVDAFLIDREVATLVALGTSDTPMGRLQKSLGLDRLPIANGGEAALVYESGQPFFTNQADQDPVVLPGIKHGLKVRSLAAVPFSLHGSHQGVLMAASATPEFFSERDLRFLTAVARWVATVAERAELAHRVAEEARAQGRRTAAEELITATAHDLRNYLTPLKARIEIIRLRATRRGEQSDRDAAEAAVREVDRLQHLIANLLDVSRLEQGIFALDLLPVDLVALALDVAEAWGTPRNPITVDAPQELTITADLHQLRRALDNVLSNALQHSPANVPIAITVHSTEAAPTTTGQSPVAALAHQRWAVIGVQDHGPGIPPEIAAGLFARYARGARSTGLGLGLYFASRIAAAHGGMLTAESPPEGGTRFAFTLPRAEAPPQGEPPQA